MLRYQAAVNERLSALHNHFWVGSNTGSMQRSNPGAGRVTIDISSSIVGIRQALSPAGSTPFRFRM